MKSLIYTSENKQIERGKNGGRNLVYLFKSPKVESTKKFWSTIIYLMRERASERAVYGEGGRRRKRGLERERNAEELPKIEDFHISMVLLYINGRNTNSKEENRFEGERE